MNDRTAQPSRTLSLWFKELVHTSEPTGDYFARLQRSVELSAPLQSGCSL